MVKEHQIKNHWFDVFNSKATVSILFTLISAFFYIKWMNWAISLKFQCRSNCFFSETILNNTIRNSKVTLDSYKIAWSGSNRKDRGVACYVKNICFNRKMVNICLFINAKIFLWKTFKTINHKILSKKSSVGFSTQSIAWFKYSPSNRSYQSQYQK